MMKRISIFRTLCFAGALFLLAMMLTEPPGSDSYIFSIGGKMILAGKLPYKDFTDAKPPGIFYLYAVIHALFGESDLAIRFFDLLYQGVTVVLLYRIISRASQNKNMAAITVFVYAFWYSSCTIWITTQCETFAVLPMLVVFLLGEHLAGGKNFRSRTVLFAGFALGVLGLFLLSLKFTLILSLFASLVYITIYGSLGRKNILTVWSCVAITLLAGYYLFIIWLKQTGGYENFSLMYEWLNGYVSMYSFADPATYRANIYRLFPRHILAMFSLSFVLLGILGIPSRRISKSGVAKERGSSFLPRRISIHLLLQFSAALLEIILERKMLLYHFTRAFWAFTPFVAQGIYFFAAYFKSRWKETSGFGYSWKFINRALLVTGVFFFVLYSPLGKVYESSVTFSYQKILHPEQPTIAFERTHPMTLSNDFAQIKALVLPTLRDSDRIFLWATHVGLFYHLNRLPPTIMLSDIQISSKWTSARLKEQVLSGLKAVSPRYIFVQQNDYLGFLTGIEGDSYASLVGWYDLFEFVDIYYEEKERTENYIIFERRKPEDVIAPL